MPFVAFRKPLTRLYHRFNVAVHGRKSSATYSRVVDAQITLKPMAFYPPHVLEGAPQMRNAGLNKSVDSGMATGIWDCTAGRFRWIFSCDEVVHILEGEVTVTIGSEVQHLSEGDVAFFPIGTVSEWHVHDYVKKMYFHRHPSPLLKHALSA